MARELPIHNGRLTTDLDANGHKIKNLPGGLNTVAWSDVTGKPSFATVATSGSYDDLSDKPTIPVPPTLAKVATSGSYNDLDDKPTIPAAQVNSDWNASSGKAQILNKPQSMPPTAHAASHATGGGDAITPADIGAAALADLPYALVTPVPSPSGGVELIDRGSNYVAVDASGYTPWVQYAGDSGFTTPEWDSSNSLWKSISPLGNSVSAYGSSFSGNETLLVFSDYFGGGAEPYTLDSYELSPTAAPGELTGTAIVHNSYGSFSVAFEDLDSYYGNPEPTYGYGCVVKLELADSPGGHYVNFDIRTAQEFVPGATFTPSEPFVILIQATFTRSALGSTAIALPAPVSGKVRDLLLLLDIAAGATVSGLSFDSGTGKTWVADGGSFPAPEAGKLNLYSFTDLPTGRVLVSRRVVEDVSAGGGS